MIIEYTTEPCMVCNQSEKLLLDEEALIKWHYGMFIQEAFPDLTPAERELIMTGTHNDCFEMLFEDME